MSQAQPPAAPPAPPAPQPPSPTTLAESDATAAANARLAEAFPEGNQPGTPDAPAAPAAAPSVDLFDDAAIDGLNFDGLQYRDGKQLRDEIVRARDTYKPFRDAFGSLDDDQRQALLDSAPTLGADLAITSQVMAALHPDDRAYFQQAMQTLAQDPIKGAEMLARGAELIREAQGAGAPAAPAAPGTSPQPEWAQPAPGVEAAPAAEAPLTRADLAAEFAQRDLQDEVRKAEAKITAQARELGYDPDAQDGTAEFDRYNYLLSVAGQPSVGFDLKKAHARVEGVEQSAIDRFVQAKSADATRPAAPAVAGVATADTRTLETMTDGHAAMTNRLDATLGPDLRRRSSED